MIDELERVRRFRADEPAPGPDTVEAARAALARAIADAAPGPAASPRTRWPRRSARRTWGLRAVAVVAACAVALVAGLPFSSGGGPSVSPALAATMNRLADIAARGPSLVPGPGQYVYFDSVNDWSSDAISNNRECVTRARQHRRVWVGADLSGLLVETYGRSRFTSAEDRAVCLAMHPSPVPVTPNSRMWFARNCWSLGPTNNLNALSTDPRTLLRQMRRIDGGPRSAAEDFVHIGDFLRETDASPALRAALYRAAALIPGVRLLGTVRDRLGRPGLGVAFEPRRRHTDPQVGGSELIFNPRTAALLAEYDGSGGWAMYYPSKLVNRLPKPSPLPLTPPCVRGAGSTKHTPAGDVETGGRARQPVVIGRPNGR